MIDVILETRHSLVRLAMGLMAGAGLVVLFALHRRRQARPMLDSAAFANRSVAGVAALLLAVSAGCWAVLVYVPVFLDSRFGWGSERRGLGCWAQPSPCSSSLPSAATSRHGWVGVECLVGADADSDRRMCPRNGSGY